MKIEDYAKIKHKIIESILQHFDGNESEIIAAYKSAQASAANANKFKFGISIGVKISPNKIGYDVKTSLAHGTRSKHDDEIVVRTTPDMFDGGE